MSVKCPPGCECDRHQQSEEHRRKNSEANRGKKKTPEAMIKRAQTMAAKAISPDDLIGAKQGFNYKDQRSLQPHYGRWYSMMTRCHRPEHPSYRHYGARGIRVCDEWLDPWGFFRYLDEVLGPCPTGHTLDRIDVDGNYEPGNVRWASRIEQAANRRPRRLYKLTQPRPCVWVIEPWKDRGVQPIWD